MPYQLTSLVRALVLRLALRQRVQLQQLKSTSCQSI
jgi:hypothetical protein